MFGHFVGTTRLSDSASSVHVERMVYGLPPPTRLLNSGDGCCWGLPVLAHEVSKHAWGLRLRRVRVGLALSSFTLLPSAPENSVGTPDGEGFRSSISCLLVPLSTLHRLSRDDQCMTRGQDGLLFLSCRTLSFLASCRFIPAFPLPASITEERLAGVVAGFLRALRA